MSNQWKNDGRVSRDIVGPVEGVVVDAVVYGLWAGIAGLYLGFGHSSLLGRTSFFGGIGAVIGALLATAKHFDWLPSRSRKPLTRGRFIGNLVLLLPLPFIAPFIDGRPIRAYDFVLPLGLALLGIREYKRRPRIGS